MRILITGGFRFIGTHLSKRLVNEGYQVTVLDSLRSNVSSDLKGVSLINADITKFEDLSTSFRKNMMSLCILQPSHQGKRLLMTQILTLK